MTVKLRCDLCKKEFEAPDDLFTDFKWPKCTCGKPFIILGEESGIPDSPSSNRKPVVPS